MIWLTQQERLTLSILGGLALVALGILLWQQHRAPITIEAGPAPSYLPAEASLPAPHSSGQAGAQWDAQLQASKLVDLNQASADELERLPEIGPSLAQRIIEYRNAHGPFRKPDELQRVPGIGPKTYEVLRDDVKVH